MTYLLHMERHKHGKTFGCQCSADIQLCTAIRQAGIQSLQLLPTENRQRAKVFSRTLHNALGIGVKLFLAVRTVYNRNQCRNHALVTGNQIIQKLSAFFPLVFHIIGNGRLKIAVLVLFSLPIGYIRFHGKELVLSLSDRFIHRNGITVDGEHQTAVDVGQLCNKAVLDEIGIIFEIQHPCITPVSMCPSPRLLDNLFLIFPTFQSRIISDHVGFDHLVAFAATPVKYV